ncbi:hypothetical protein L914_08872 [Phytophthora nicotianae]|uniref:Uncharacterized protein n=2 Tax=Phytophthora nicotianae TaxID=4792 RepID=V9F4L6_PHYNI|nr:hypothetical protein F443_09176 [Phytophthora nicotianae P1569]ETL39791.1 hypothetical protein L916_08913 [Phytophthora nicotianae]ETM46204.1 hypothetical protein L914_08872 [Phytophthora nicotianae]
MVDVDDEENSSALPGAPITESIHRESCCSCSRTSSKLAPRENAASEGVGTEERIHVELVDDHERDRLL